MSDSTATPPVENVSRGITFALVAIPVGIIASALLGSLLGIASGIVALIVAYLAGWLYSKGAGGPFEGKMVGPAGRLPYVLIAAAAVILGAITSVVAAVYSAFTSVNGPGGLFGSAFATTLGRVLSEPGDIILPILLCLVFGAVGIASVVRGPKAKQQEAAYPGQPGYPVQPTQPTQPGYPAQPTTAAGYPVADQSAAPQAPSIPTTPPVAPNQPSPGVILNGKPVDPTK